MSPIPSARAQRCAAASLVVLALLASASVPAAALAAAPRETDDQDKEIVVNGTKLVRIRPNDARQTTTISAADLQALPNTNVVEALARTSGISVSVTEGLSPSEGNHGGIDGAARGTSNFVSIRGLSGSYNVNLLNGVNAAQGMPYSRNISLGLLPPIGLKQIVVSKTSTANMDGDAVGGTLDFQTPTAHDFGTSLNRIYLQGGFSQLAHDYHAPAGSYLGQAEFARQFGADHAFGIYATGYYGKRRFAATQLDFQGGQWGYAVSVGKQGTNPDGFNREENLILKSANAQFSRGEELRYGGAVSLDWHGDATSLWLKATHARSEIQQQIYQKGIQAGNYPAPVLRPDGLYQNGESDGEYHYWFETAPANSQLSSVQLGGETQLGRLVLRSTSFYSYGLSAAPNHAEITYLASPANDLNGPFQVTYRNQYPIPLLSAAQLGRLNNNSLFGYEAGSGEYTAATSSAKVYGSKFDAVYALGGLFQEIAVGAKFSRSERSSDNVDYSNIDFVPLNSTLANGSLFTGQVIADKNYYPYTLPIGNAAELTRLAAAAAVTLSPDSRYKNVLAGNENVAAGYALARMQWGALEIQPGVRYESTVIHNRFWSKANSAGQVSGFQTNRSANHIFLPSLHLVLRSGDAGVFRAAIWRSYSRPAFFQLGGGRTVKRNTDGTFSVTEGNPNLRPMTSTNYDLSLERSGRVYRVSVAAFYKDMNDYMYDRGTDYRSTPALVTTDTTVSKPSNGGRAHVYGLELDGEFRFRDLPGALSGLGVAGNVTLQRSAARLLDPTTDAVQPMAGVPQTLYNASIFFNPDRFEARLSYHFNGRLLSKYKFGATGGALMSEWTQATGSLDASFAYKPTPSLRLAATVSNLLDSVSFYRTVGKDAETVPQIVRAGRQAGLSLTYGF